MRYPLLEQYETFNANLFFWMQQYLINKLLTASKDKVSDNFDLSKYTKMLKDSQEIKDISAVASIVRKEKLDGFNPVYLSITKLYSFLIVQGLYSIKDISNSMISGTFINQCEKDGVAITTRKRHHTIAINFFDYIENNNQADKNTTEPYLLNISKDVSGKRIKQPFKKTYKKVPIHLNEEELSLVNQSIPALYNKKTLIDTRDILILRFLIFSGITATELVNLKLKDIKEVDGKVLELHIDALGAKKRDIPMPKSKLMRYYNKYIELCDLKDDDYFFYNTRDNKQLSASYVLKIVKALFSKLDKESILSKSNIVVDIFRNSYAIYLYNKRFPNNQKYPLKYIQHFMGDAKLQTTHDRVKHHDIETAKISDMFEDL